MKYYVVDAFANKRLDGNTARICIMDNWLTGEVMQQITSKNNLSKTAFVVKENVAYYLHWFTLSGEVDLCGHATLAATFVLADFIEPPKQKFRFTTVSSTLIVKHLDDLDEMDFPKYELAPVPITDEMKKAIRYFPVEAWIECDLVCVLSTEQQVETAESSFTPKLNIRKDPVCGSSHCYMAPFRAEKSGTSKLVARQTSKRGGTIHAKVRSDRVKSTGKAVLYSIA